MRSNARSRAASPAARAARSGHSRARGRGAARARRADGRRASRRCPRTRRGARHPPASPGAAARPRQSANGRCCRCRRRALWLEQRAVLGPSSTSSSLPANQHREEIPFHPAHLATDSGYRCDDFLRRRTQCLGPACNIGVIVAIDSFVVVLPRRAPVVGHCGLLERWTQPPYPALTLG